MSFMTRCGRSSAYSRNSDLLLESLTPPWGPQERFDCDLRLCGPRVLRRLPRGGQERFRQRRSMVNRFDVEAFGIFIGTFECAAASPQGVRAGRIFEMSGDRFVAVAEGT